MVVGAVDGDGGPGVLVDPVVEVYDEMPTTQDIDFRVFRRDDDGGS